MSSRTQIVATIGPASADAATVKAMLEAGMDVARINFSHGTHKSDGAYIDVVRAEAQKLGKRVPIIADLSGPRKKTDSGHAFNAQSAEITQKDLDDLAFALGKNVEYVAQSYVGGAEDVKNMKRAIAHLRGEALLIAKIERREAVNALEEIIAEADAVMVARGDLGLAVPIENIPFIERNIIAKANTARKPVITATQMLLTMTENEEPSRAEVTDVSFAVLEGSDAVMLSEETALGKHPIEAVATMEKIANRAEREVSRSAHSL